MAANVCSCAGLAADDIINALRHSQPFPLERHKAIVDQVLRL